MQWGEKSIGKGDEVFDSAKHILGAGHSNDSNDTELIEECF